MYWTENAGGMALKKNDKQSDVTLYVDDIIEMILG
jgi:hypothetical protein